MLRKEHSDVFSLIFINRICIQLKLYGLIQISKYFPVLTSEKKPVYLKPTSNGSLRAVVLVVNKPLYETLSRILWSKTIHKFSSKRV